MRMTLRALAALLAYPSAELLANARAVGEALDAEGALPRAARHRLRPLLERLATGELLEVQAEYSDLFDRSRSLSLHLFEHVHGDSKERGQAMLDLGQQYLDAGFLLDSRELPDFVPVFLEFASCLEARAARDMLRQPAHVFAALAGRLDERQSPYAEVFHAAVALAGVRPDAAAVEELRRNAPSEDPARLDEEWEDKAITFTRPAHEMGGPTGIAARVRATVKARAAARPEGGRQ